MFTSTGGMWGASNLGTEASRSTDRPSRASAFWVSASSSTLAASLTRPLARSASASFAASANRTTSPVLVATLPISAALPALPTACSLAGGNSQEATFSTLLVHARTGLSWYRSSGSSAYGSMEIWSARKELRVFCALSAYSAAPPPWLRSTASRIGLDPTPSDANPP